MVTMITTGTTITDLTTIIAMATVTVLIMRHMAINPITTDKRPTTDTHHINRHLHDQPLHNQRLRINQHLITSSNY